MAGPSQLPTLRVMPEEISDRVLVVGDPARAEAAADLLDRSDRIGANREFATYSGTHAGERITVCSHGVGSAGAGICFEELARAGARVMLRAGTCGAIQDDIEDGALVVASAAVRDEGLTPRLVPDGYPAVAHFEVVAALGTAISTRGETARIGPILSTDRFYPSQVIPVDWQSWKLSGLLAVEMELAPLFVIASLHGIKAGGILTVDGNPTLAAQDMSEYDPFRTVVEEGVHRMLEIAIDALTTIGTDR